MCVSVLAARLYMCHVCAWYLQRSEVGIRYSGTGYCCEPPCRGWQQNQDPLKEKQMLFMTESPPPPIKELFSKHLKAQKE